VQIVFQQRAHSQMNAIGRYFTTWGRRVRQLIRRLQITVQQFSWNRYGRRFAWRYREGGGPSRGVAEPRDNPLSQFCERHREGPGIWKWQHYFEIYHRHLARFVGHDIQFAEVGVFSGGSLGMWKAYFGEQAHIHGVDLDEATRVYAADLVTIHIGDQEDREFWSRFRHDVPLLDVIVDDGGHTPEQQRVTMEEMLPHLRAGGVYICEDIHAEDNAFSAFVAGLVQQLNSMNGGMEVAASPFQSAIASIHCYPYVVVIEKQLSPQSRLLANRYGTEWQPPIVVRHDYGQLLGRGG